MVYIKKLVMKGFKSFASETEIQLINGMTVVVGPNGSGKSNITNAICFVLGRLSVKSMRAEKTSNLIFAGTKEHKPAGEASVKLIFDNSDKKFSIDKNEVTIERIVRSNGQGIYKINGEVKTRQEVLELLAFAGIDPYGFNIVLQGEIDSLVKMNSEERRKIIEEVAGISIYELRKEKSLKELEKTEEKLKEVSSILRERTSYLRNLEEERRQALKFKKLEENEKKLHASIIHKKIEAKNKELAVLNSKSEEKEKAKLALKEKISKLQLKIDELQSEIEQINSSIQKSSGIEQNELQAGISDLRARRAGLEVRKENNESKLQEILAKKSKTENDIKLLKEEIERLRKEFPSQARKYQDLEKKKRELDELEKQRKILYSLREKLSTIKNRLADKEHLLEKNKNESGFIIREINRIAEEVFYKDTDSCRKNIQRFKSEIFKSEQEKKILEEKIKEQEKSLLLAEAEISNLEKIKKQVHSLDICPLCKSKITEEHIKQVFKECDEKIGYFQEQIKKTDKTLAEELKKTKENLLITSNNLTKAEIDLIKLENAEERKQQIKRISAEEEALRAEILAIEKERKSLELKTRALIDIEPNYDRIFLELQEISSRTQDNLDADLEYKGRDLEKARIFMKQLDRDLEEAKFEISELGEEIEDCEKELEEKEMKEQELEKKFQKLLDRKSLIEKEIHQHNSMIFEVKNELAIQDNEINNLKIEKARLDAEKENLDTDFSIYLGIELVSMPLSALEQKLQETKLALSSIGSVNLRALEVYENMKKGYDLIAEKVLIIQQEKEEIMKIIQEIDTKKKKTFMKTLNEINLLFNRNFTQLLTKGSVSLELENNEDIFAGGLDIVVKVGKGKYFDVTSLSGGEQTLVALSLIFAIQEYKPYSFYIFDEVDAALDKRNSERLANLIKRYMKTGQYIIITHNDAIITESSVLYGVSMQEGISKILSLEI